jgi:hypothetical protein
MTCPAPYLKPVQEGMCRLGLPRECCCASSGKRASSRNARNERKRPNDVVLVVQNRQRQSDQLAPSERKDGL